MSEFVDRVERTLPGTLRHEGARVTLTPASATVLSQLLEIAQATTTPLQVPGGEPGSGRPILLLDRLDGILSVDEESRILHVQAGIAIGDVERRAHDHGWTLGVPKAYRAEPVGGWLARGAPGRPDKEDDPVNQLIAGIEIVLPDGRLLETRPAPRRAVGPDLIRAAIGARGRLGIIVGVHLVAAARVARTLYGFSFANEETAARVLFEVRGAGVRPSSAQCLGADLHLTLEAEGARHVAATKVMHRIVEAHGGRTIERPVAATPGPRVGGNEALFSRLAEELDPNAVLQP